MKKSISVVIPNYNGKDLLEKNLPFLYDSLDSSGINDYEVIISDDNSSDGSIQFLKENYSKIIIIENKTNQGFASNCNIGIFAAKKELVLLLNTDVKLTQNYFTKQLEYFNNDDTFGVMARIMAENSEIIQDGAKFPKKSLGYLSTTANYLPKDDKYCYSLFLSGANALIDRKKLQLLKGFNEIFNPYYSEDAELGLRAWRMGWKLYFENSSYCYHPLSATIKKEPSRKVKIITKRNRMFLHYLHLNGPELYYFQFFEFLKSHLKLIFGNTEYFESYQQFKKSTKELKKLKNEFSQLQKNNNLNLSINDIMKFLKHSINMNNIKIL